VFFLAWAAGSMALWVLLTTTFDGSELVAGAIAAVLAGAALEALHHRVRFGFRPRLRWFLRAPRFLWRIVPETWLAIVVLVRHATGSKRVRGAFVAVPFRHGAPGDPEASARRALATAALSLAPNTMVVGIDPGRNELLAHQLQPDVEELRRSAGSP
jgi:multisubunit Na+/H+ antiporter MnhE subunit